MDFNHGPLACQPRQGLGGTQPHISKAKAPQPDRDVRFGVHKLRVAAHHRAGRAECPRGSMGTVGANQKYQIAALNLSPEGLLSGLSGFREGLIFLLWLGGVARLCGPVVLFSVAPAPEFVVQDGGEHIDAAIVDGDCIGAECASGNRKALVL